MDTITQKIKHHFENKKYAKITRSVGKGVKEINSGYIVDYSDDFILLQEAGDFIIEGYVVFPVSQIKKIRFIKWDKYFHKIIIAEKEIEKVGVKYKIDLCDWPSIFKSIQNHQLNVIIKCEEPGNESFDIGPITNVTDKLVNIHNFDPSGLLDEEPTPITFENVSVVEFDDRYINIFSKYLRHRKLRK
jgi:hypothetical protein